MSYWNDFEEERNRSHADLITKNILDGIQKLENKGGDRARRRWFWELLQNAKDVARPEQGLHVSVSLNQSDGNSLLTFRHDGRAFRPADIVRLIEQNSSKTRDADSESKTTGRFGTGFLTTHLLSRKVHVDGVVRKEGRDPRRFSLPLNREGRSKEEIIEGVEESFSELRRIEEAASFREYKPSAFNTSFQYQLDPRGVEVAKKGIEDAHRDLPLTLALNRTISSVEFAHQGVTYRRGERKTLADNVAVVSVVRQVREEESDLSSARFSFLVVSSDKVDVALPVENNDGSLYLRDFPEETPHLFLDFPLIGTESFPLPVVINSSFFQPSEERNGVWLTEADTEEASTNRQLLTEAVVLYRNLLDRAAEREWHDLFVLAGVGTPGNHDWLSKKWFRNAVQQPLRKKILCASIIETPQGEWKPMKSATGNDEVYLPKDSDPEVREDLWSFAHAWVPNHLPRKEHVHEWCRRMWSECPELDIHGISRILHSRRNLERLAKMLECSQKDAVEWLNKWVQFLLETGSEKYLGRFRFKQNGKIISRGLPILPNQNGTFCTREQLFLDDDIDDDLKDIATDLGEDVREDLLDPRVRLELPEHKVRTSKDIAATIRERIEDQKMSQSPGSKDAQTRLFAWMCRHEARAEELFGDLYRNRLRLRPNEDLAEDYEKRQRYDELTSLLAEHGLSESDLPGLLKSRGMSEQILTDIQDGQGQPDFEAISAEIKGRDVTTPTDFQELIAQHPELFAHIPESSREAFKRWLGLIAQRKHDVRTLLDTLSAYDCSGWNDDSRFPTLVTGVRRHGRDIYLVVRPSDQGKIILYHDLEIDALDTADAELWVSDGTGRPQQLTIGKLLRSMGVTAGMGIRL